MSDTENDPTTIDEPVVGVQVAPEPSTDKDQGTTTRTKRQPPYHVILFNDEEHTFDYVIELLMKLFRHNQPTAEALTLQVHLKGRAIVFTTHRELAELKRDQVIAYGPDPRMSASKGPIGCSIEAAE